MVSGKLPTAALRAFSSSAAGTVSAPMRASCASNSTSALSVTSVRTSADAWNAPTPLGRWSDEYAPYVQLFCSRRIMNSRASAPPPNTRLAIDDAYQSGSVGVKVVLPTTMLDCTEPGRCTISNSVLSRVGTAGAAGTAAGAPVQPASAFSACRRALARDMFPATTIKALRGLTRAA